MRRPERAAQRADPGPRTRAPPCAAGEGLMPKKAQPKPPGDGWFRPGDASEPPREGILSEPLVLGARRRLTARASKACAECLHLGWFVAEIDREPTYEIERCDNCQAYADDQEACTAAALLLALLVSDQIHTLTADQREMVRDAARTLGDDYYTSERKTDAKAS